MNTFLLVRIREALSAIDVTLVLSPVEQHQGSVVKYWLHSNHPITNEEIVVGHLQWCQDTMTHMHMSLELPFIGKMVNMPGSGTTYQGNKMYALSMAEFSRLQIVDAILLYRQLLDNTTIRLVKLASTTLAFIRHSDAKEVRKSCYMAVNYAGTSSTPTIPTMSQNLSPTLMGSQVSREAISANDDYTINTMVYKTETKTGHTLDTFVTLDLHGYGKVTFSSAKCTVTTRCVLDNTVLSLRQCGDADRTEPQAPVVNNETFYDAIVNLYEDCINVRPHLTTIN